MKKTLCSPRLLLPLLVVSAGLNAWLLWRPGGEAEEKVSRHPLAAVHPAAASPAAVGPKSGKNREQEESNEGAAPAKKSPPQVKPPERRSEDELVFGNLKYDPKMVFGEPSGKVSPQRLKELANMPASKAEKFQLHARLMLPGDRVMDLGVTEMGAGQRAKLERLKEVPYPTGFAMADGQSRVNAGGGSYPVTPTKPTEFATRNTGLEIDLDVTPTGGTLVLGGNFRQTALVGFSRMPGEIFSPVWEGDTIFTDNKVMQPQFGTQEVPFVAAATAGQPCLVPVRMEFGQTFLELTCTPVE